MRDADARTDSAKVTYGAQAQEGSSSKGESIEEVLGTLVRSGFNVYEIQQRLLAERTNPFRPRRISGRASTAGPTSSYLIEKFQLFNR